MAVITFANWPDTLDELAEDFVNRLIYTDVKYEDALKIFSGLYLKRLEKEHPNRAKHLRGKLWVLETF